MPNKISAFLVVRNEQDVIARALKSLKFCDEIIVVDQHSTDKTVDIAKQFTKKIYFDKKWGYCEPSRKIAIAKCKNNWILNIDADEEITENLKNEIIESININSKNKNYFPAYYIHRNFFMFGKHVLNLDKDDYVLRLHRKGVVQYTNEIHNGVVISGKIKTGRLLNSMNHYALIHFRQLIDKAKRYTDIQASTDKKYASFPRKYFGIFFTPIYYFIYHYFINMGIIDGWRGLLWSILGSYYEILVYLKVWFRK